MLLVGYHPFSLEALRTELVQAEGVQAETRLVDDLLAAGGEYDVVLLDPATGGGFNLDVVEHIRNQWPSARLVIFSDCARRAEILRALALGVHSYILKTETAETVHSSIQAVCGGLSVFSPMVAAVMTGSLKPPQGQNGHSTNLHKKLSPREVEILQHIASGLPDAEIAAMLAISKRTVSRHVTGILNKLGSRTRSQAVAAAFASDQPVELPTVSSKAM